MLDSTFSSSVDTGQSRLNVLLQTLPSKDFNVVFKMLGTDEDIRDVLQEFKDTKRHRIICDTSLNGTRRLLREVGAICNKTLPSEMWLMVSRYK